MSENNNLRIPWWLWPNVLGLDAAIIAVIWQETFARAFMVSLPWPPRLALFFATLTVYTGDRWLDTRDTILPANAPHRHRFAAAHPRIIVGISLFSALSAGICVLFLPVDWIIAGFALLFTIGLYFAWTHLGVGFKKPPLIKEVLVSTLFTLGVILPMAVRGATQFPAFWRAAGLLAALCLVNCLQVDAFSNSKRRPKLAFFCLASAVLCLIASSAVINRLTLTGLVPATAISAGLLALTGIVARFAGDRFASIYCDLTLLTPLFFLLSGPLHLP